MKPYRQAFSKAIPREHWRAVFYENARKVFKMQGLPAAEQLPPAETCK